MDRVSAHSDPIRCLPCCQQSRERRDRLPVLVVLVLVCHARYCRNVARWSQQSPIESYRNYARIEWIVRPRWERTGSKTRRDASKTTTSVGSRWYSLVWLNHVLRGERHAWAGLRMGGYHVVPRRLASVRRCQACRINPLGCHRLDCPVIANGMPGVAPNAAGRSTYCSYSPHFSPLSKGVVSGVGFFDTLRQARG